MSKKNKVRIGVSVSPEVLDEFRKVCNENKLQISPVVDLLMKYFLEKIKEID